MGALARLTTPFPRAMGLRTIATRANTIDTPRTPLKDTTPASTRADSTRPTTAVGVYGNGRTHWESSSHTRWTADERGRSFYSTQIYHGQTRRASTCPIGRGPATGMGTGVSIVADNFGCEVKANPTVSEANVAADRCDYDPLAPGLHHTIRLDAGGAAAEPTESEEDVAADLGRRGPDPLTEKK
ncbi:hypothetical protein BT67DRAFT_264288 [Trichocladium antarcticum]|uniref:Uncharacterized protein n=1 Tax=Trichocladium antarcticum TaxID=1450529 RepID=A0AAN6ZEA1_9PEZI|nr:hypothetical protein BT67DRAFT_264288 [Trichocladium antarcticum]